ncbi:MAG: c-type cytochrome biogenesis protein CcmI [Dokdonella sp.]|uniref:c-type cytochrome biogenesis protein CcmI n=1 Tax=Dokdonella sp. TaxID=2291710 RepID=UPI003263FD43
MTMFFLIAALMIAAALAFVLVPLQRHRGDTSAMDTDARRQRALDEALAAGVIDNAEYVAKRAALPVAATTANPRSRIAFVALVLVTLLLPAAAMLLYRLVGAPQALDPANLVAATDPSRGDNPGPEMEQAIGTLVTRLKEHPEDAEGWSLLARAYQATDRAAESLDAYRHAHELAKDNALVTVEYAQALALATPGHRIAGESRQLLEGVLKDDATNQRALWLLGISDYQSAQYDSAIARWNALLPLLDGQSTIAESVRKQIADAQDLRDGKTPSNAPTPSQPPATASTSGETAAVSSAAPSLTIRVALDPTLQKQLDPDATLFVFARAASGPPMPLAIQRLKAGALPLTVTLDESMGMLPTMKLSMFPQVIVGARISRSGNALPQSGDLQKLSAPLDVHASAPIQLTIDQMVP